MEPKVKIASGLFGAAALAGLALSAYAQGLPSGSYQQSCRDFRMQGGTLTAVCRRANGRGDQQSAARPRGNQSQLPLAGQREWPALLRLADKLDSSYRN